MPQVIEEETSDEDNSSNDSNKVAKKQAKHEQKTEVSKKLKSECSNEFKSTGNKLGKTTKDTSSYKRQESGGDGNKSNKIEEEKIHHKNSSSFHDISDRYDFIRKHRSGSCKSAAASLKFTKKRNSIKKITSSPFAPLSRKSYHLSTSTSKEKNMSSFVGISNIKTSELSVADSTKIMQSQSRCLSDVSWNMTYLESDEKKSLPIQRYDSNSSLLSGNSGKGGNASTTTLTSKSDFNWDFRSLRNTSCHMPRLDTHMEEYPYSKRRGKMRKRPVYKAIDTLPELIECEENLEEEYFSIRHNRINIIEDLNEFGRRSKRHRSLDGGSKKNKAYNAPNFNTFYQYQDVTETDEKDWASEDSNCSKSKPLSKISIIFNKIYADLFERPIRMKQIKERSRRNINALGDDPINEDSNDSSNKTHKNEQQSDASSSTVSFRKRDVHTLFDGLDKPKKTLSCCNKFFGSIEDPIFEVNDEYPQPRYLQTSNFNSSDYDSKSEIIKFKSRHDRREIFDKILDKKDQMPNKSSMKMRSISFDNEPILEENDEDNDNIEKKFFLSISNR